MQNSLIKIYRKIQFEYKIGIVYTIIGILWIFLSDAFFDATVLNMDSLTRIQMIKGSFYVIVTSYLLFYLLKRHMKKIRMADNNLKQKNEEIEAQNEELIVAKEKAEENDLLKTAFLHNISHEIRTPMNAIVGFSQFLAKPRLTEEKRESYATIVQNSSLQLLTIVNDILTISALESNQERLVFKLVCINDIINELLLVFKTQINQNIQINANVDLTNEQAIIYTDKTKITQILTNLLNNAVKFTKEGKIEFGYFLVESNRGESLQPELQFYVKDTGIGIKAEMHKMIFDRFCQEDKHIQQTYGGTGLGLSIAKGFVDLLGGKIWVESEIGKGTTFYFTIAKQPHINIEHGIAESQKQSEPIKKEINILIAEDDENNQFYLKEILSELNFKLIFVKNGQEAVDVCKSSLNISLILMDIKMPVMDGYMATQQIREIRHGLPVIAQTAYAMDYERLKYGDMFDDYLAKPINELELKRKILKYLRPVS